MTETDMNSEEPRKKRKYTKRAKMLMRSNNDYIDHDYWPRMYAAAKKRDKLMRQKYPERYAKVIQPTIVELAPVVTRQLTPEQLAKLDVDNCSIYGIKCSKHNMFHNPPEMPKNSNSSNV